MRFMNKILAMCVLLYAGSANSDLVYINIGPNWPEKVDVKWVAELEEIDDASDLATFYYESNEGDGKFKVHVTRIYSIVFQQFERMTEDYPTNNSHRDLEAALKFIRSKDRSRGILLDNTGGILDEEIPKKAIVEPKDRQGSELKVYGVITYMDEEDAILNISKRGGGRISITVDRSLVKSWNRG